MFTLRRHQLGADLHRHQPLRRDPTWTPLYPGRVPSPWADRPSRPSAPRGSWWCTPWSAGCADPTRCSGARASGTGVPLGSAAPPTARGTGRRAAVADHRPPGRRPERRQRLRHLGGDLRRRRPALAWSDRQLTALVGLAVWWCGGWARRRAWWTPPATAYRLPRTVPRVGASTVGPAPGPVRIEQLRTIVILRVRRRCPAPPPPGRREPAGRAHRGPAPATAGPSALTGADVKAVQAAIGMPAGSGTASTAPDPDAVRHAQIEHHLTPDGAVG